MRTGLAYAELDAVLGVRVFFARLAVDQIFSEDPHRNYALVEDGEGDDIGGLVHLNVGGKFAGNRKSALIRSENFRLAGCKQGCSEQKQAVFEYLVHT